MEGKMLKAYEISIENTLYCLDVRCGCMNIANIWPPRKPKRLTWQVRLLFNQFPREIDYSKDRQFKDKEECINYIHFEFRKYIKALHRKYVLNKYPLIKVVKE